MAKGVFMHYPESVYDDLPETRYHYPAQYRRKVEQVVGDFILYYEPGKHAKYYKAVARVLRIEPDPKKKNNYYAIIDPTTYLPFERHAPLKLNGKYLNSAMIKSDGTMDLSVSRSAVQILSDTDFARIITYGFPEEAEDLPRMDESDSLDEVAESPIEFNFDLPDIVPRITEKILLNKKVRDRAFRSNVLRAYNKTCAFTGLRFINGGGRAEVQAAHIRPVAHDGPDSVNNAMALSGTVHWMFDRGMLSLSDDATILVSRHINNTEEIARLLVKDRKARLPIHPAERPHADYLSWHREHRFKT